MIPDLTKRFLVSFYTLICFLIHLLLYNITVYDNLIISFAITIITYPFIYLTSLIESLHLFNLKDILTNFILSSVVTILISIILDLLLLSIRKGHLKSILKKLLQRSP